MAHGLAKGGGYPGSVLFYYYAGHTGHYTCLYAACCVAIGGVEVNLHMFFPLSDIHSSLVLGS